MNLEQQISYDLTTAKNRRSMSDKDSNIYYARRLPPIMEANMNYFGSLNRHITTKQLQQILDQEEEIYQNNLLFSLQTQLRGQRDPRLVGARLPNPSFRNSSFHRTSHPLANQQLLALPRGEKQKQKRSTSIGQRVLIGCLFATYLVLALFTVLFVVGQAQFGKSYQLAKHP